MQVNKYKEVCVCGFEMDSHRGILTFETLRSAVESLMIMKPDDWHQCCDNYRRDNLKYLEEVANGR